MSLFIRLRGFLKELKQHNTPPQILYIVDYHFYHNRICFEMNRHRFSGYEEVNRYMITQSNKKARPKDDINHLRDFSITNSIFGSVSGLNFPLPAV